MDAPETWMLPPAPTACPQAVSSAALAARRQAAGVARTRARPPRRRLAPRMIPASVRPLLMVSRSAGRSGRLAGPITVGRGRSGVVAECGPGLGPGLAQAADQVDRRALLVV